MFFNQTSTQVYSLFGTYVVEHHESWGDDNQRHKVPEPTLFEAASNNAEKLTPA